MKFLQKYSSNPSSTGPVMDEAVLRRLWYSVFRIDRNDWHLGNYTFKYKDRWQSGLEPIYHSSTSSNFRGEGHIIDFPVRDGTKTYQKASGFFTELYLNGLFDQNLRFLTLDFRFYNPQTMHHTFARIAVEFSAGAVTFMQQLNWLDKGYLFTNIDSFSSNSFTFCCFIYTVSYFWGNSFGSFQFLENPKAKRWCLLANHFT